MVAPRTDETDLLTDEEIVSAVRVELEGEDPETGVAPTTTTVIDVDLELPAEAGGGIDLGAWDKEDRRLGLIPAEALHVLLSRTYGSGWHRLDHDAILKDFLDEGIVVDQGGYSRFMALKAILDAQQEAIGFYRSWRAFAFLTLSLLGIPVRWDAAHSPTPLQMAQACRIVTEIRPGEFKEEVLKFIAATCMTYQLWVMPRELSAAQPYVYPIADYMDLPITREDVEEVQRRVVTLRGEGRTSDTLPEPQGSKDVQVELLLSLLEDRDEATRRAEAVRDAVQPLS